MPITRQEVIDALHKAVTECNGTLPGRMKFTKISGIREKEYIGIFWRTFGAMAEEAGYTKNQKNSAIDGSVLIQAIIALANEIGHYPASVDIRLKGRNDKAYPSHNTFQSLGSKRDQVLAVMEHCDKHGLATVSAFCKAKLLATPEADSNEDESGTNACIREGYVYLYKHGSRKEYKIGKTVDLNRRGRELVIQLPERIDLVHEIRTDDIDGIEKYWHERFRNKRMNGEWFALMAADISAFKSRKRM